MVHSFPTRRSSDLNFILLGEIVQRVARKPLQDFVRSEEHTSELQSHHPISYAVFCLKKKKKPKDPGARPYAFPWSVGRLRRCAQFLFRRRNGAALVFDYFFFNDTATTEIYTGWYTLSLHDALPISTVNSDGTKSPAPVTSSFSHV